MNLMRQRNSSYEKSQDLPLAAAEHYFYAKQEVRDDPSWLAVIKLGEVFGYEGVKAFAAPLAIGFGRYAFATTSYPATPTTAASVACGMWGILEGAVEGPAR